MPGGREEGFGPVHAGLPELVRVIHQHDAVVDHDADQQQSRCVNHAVHERVLH